MIPKSRLTDGPQVRAAFREAINEARQSTVEIRSEGRRIALGGIVGADGWILTKASRLKEPIVCRLEDGLEFDARLVGIDRPYDLAMLKIDATELPMLGIKSEDDSDVGDWVATVALQEDPIAVGVVSVDTREIRIRGGWLGVGLDQVQGGARITQVYPESGAAEAGVLVNDVVLSVNGELTPTQQKLGRTVKKHRPGDTIELVIQRGEEKLTLRAELTARVKGMPNDRRDFQDRLGSELSERRFGFPHALQHDTVLRPVDCGGPLVDLEGRVVGFNIARAGRTESYAIPAEIVVTRLYDLMSGKLAPQGVETEEAAEEAEEEAAAEEESEEAKGEASEEAS
ncbi:MAG: S1C family serine protease [Aeoliella sp.]